MYTEGSNREKSHGRNSYKLGSWTQLAEADSVVVQITINQSVISAATANGLARYGEPSEPWLAKPACSQSLLQFRYWFLYKCRAVKATIADEVKRMRVLLADDQAKVRSALRLLLEQQPGLSVIGEATEAESLLAQAEVTCPDLVLLDWELPGLRATDLSTGSGAGSGHHLLSVLRTLCPHLLVIALSGRPEARRAALTAGADAFVSKGDPPERLLSAVDDCWHR